MSSSFFNPEKIDITGNLILLPWFPDRNYFNGIVKRSLKKRVLLGSELLQFPDYDILAGFLGYSNLLTLLEFINGVKYKNIFFLGTAGSLNPEINYPVALNVSEIYPGSIFKYFSVEKKLNLNRSDDRRMKNVKGISIDLIQRETREWYNDQKVLMLDIVEMEIFPLRWYTGKKFTAFVVTTDQVTASGIKIFSEKNKIKNESVRAFEYILELINET